jgi:hypothetical protein
LAPWAEPGAALERARDAGEAAVAAAVVRLAPVVVPEAAALAAAPSSSIQ